MKKGSEAAGGALVELMERLPAAQILPWYHILFSDLKGWLRGTFHGVSRKNLWRYLQELISRTPRRLARA